MVAGRPELVVEGVADEVIADFLDFGPRRDRSDAQIVHRAWLVRVPLLPVPRAEGLRLSNAT